METESSKLIGLGLSELWADKNVGSLSYRGETY